MFNVLKIKGIKGLGKLCFISFSTDIEEIVTGPFLQNDFRIVNYIRSNGFIKEPAAPHTKYQLEEPEVSEQSIGQADVVRTIFKNMVSRYINNSRIKTSKKSRP